jgi:hypothetical protein
MNDRLRFAALSFVLPVALLALTLPTEAGAQTEYLFEAELSGANEVPPTAAPQTGTVSAILNETMTQVSYVIEYDPIPDETGAHFHLAPPGSNGPVVHGLPSENPKIGVWDIDPAHVDELFAGNIYVNIHSSEYPGGAIRANLTSYTVPVESLTWREIKSLFR